MHTHSAPNALIIDFNPIAEQIKQRLPAIESVGIDRSDLLTTVLDFVDDDVHANEQMSDLVAGLVEYYADDEAVNPDVPAILDAYELIGHHFIEEMRRCRGFELSRPHTFELDGWFGRYNAIIRVKLEDEE